MLNIVTLPPLEPGARLIFVGDIHGCSEEFDRLVDTVRYNQGRDKLVLVGDLVNKGYDSIGVIKRAMSLGAYCVLGNHDATLIARVEGIREGFVQPDVYPHTEDPMTQLAKDLPRECYKFLTSMPHLIRIPQFNIIVVHAGINPKLDLASQNLWEILHMRRILPTGRVVDAQKGGELWATKWHGPETIIFGHDARTGLQRHPFAIGLDSGCCYGGDLTAYLLPSKDFVSVRGSKRGVTKKPPQASPETRIGFSPSTEEFGSPNDGGGNMTVPTAAVNSRGGKSEAFNLSHAVGAAPSGTAPFAFRPATQAATPGTNAAATEALKSLLRSKNPSPGLTPPTAQAAPLFPSAPPASAMVDTRPVVSAVKAVPQKAKEVFAATAPAKEVSPEVVVPAPKPVTPEPPEEVATNGHQKGAGSTVLVAETTALLRHLFDCAAEVVATPVLSATAATSAIHLLCGGPMNGYRQQLLDLVSPKPWAAFVIDLLRHTNDPVCPASIADEALLWLQDIAESKPDTLRYVDHGELESYVASSTASRRVVKSTLIAIRP